MESSSSLEVTPVTTAAQTASPAPDPTWKAVLMSLQRCAKISQQRSSSSTQSREQKREERGGRAHPPASDLAAGGTADIIEIETTFWGKIREILESARRSRHASFRPVRDLDSRKRY